MEYFASNPFGYNILQALAPGKVNKIITLAAKYPLGGGGGSPALPMNLQSPEHHREKK
jgi:hypothetical protein